jgi:hypothetical protein
VPKFEPLHDVNPVPFSYSFLVSQQVVIVLSKMQNIKF